MNKTNGNIKTKEKVKGENKSCQECRRLQPLILYTHTHTSNLGKIIKIYIKEKGNIILSSSYYDTG